MAELAAAPALLDRVPSWAPPASLAIAGAAGLTLVGRPAGLGLTLTAWAVFAIVARAVAPRDRWAAAMWLLAGALAAVVTLRAAGWVQVLSLLAALALAAVAAFGSARWKDLGAALGWWLAALVPGPVMLAGALLRRRWAGTLPALRGALLAAPLLLVFGALFAAADAAFAELLDDAGATLAELDASRAGVSVLVAGIAGALLWTAVAPRPRTAEQAPRRPIGRTEWLVALGALDALFALFVVLQLPVLFGGHGHVLVTPDLTYADYAHQGFGQLLVVAALTLGVVAAAVRWCRREDERALRALLGTLCLLCLVVLASAWQRLDVYVEAFGPSRLRLLAQWGVAEVAAVLVLVLAAGTRRTAPWLPRAIVTTTAVAWLAFALANPDARIAERSRDLGYALTLSEDAAGAVANLPACDRDPGRGGVLAFNFGRARC
jgi:hypothetical protein